MLIRLWQIFTALITVISVKCHPFSMDGSVGEGEVR